MSIRHAKTSGIPNPADTTLVGGADWDAAHVGSGLDPANMVYLEANGSLGAYGPVWDTIYDQEQNAIGSPAAVGITLTDGGSRVQIDEAGLYWFELVAQFLNDATAQVDVVLHVEPDWAGGPRVLLSSVRTGITAEACLWAMASVPASALPGHVSVSAAALFDPLPTANPYEPWSYGVLKVIRLA